MVVDDLTFLEIINLLNAGLASYNLKQHVPSHIENHNQILDSNKLKSKEHLEVINGWTKKKKNEAKYQKN